MAIRMRRGLESELDISKAVPGEWLVSTDTRYVRMCFAPGIVLRMATYEAFEADTKKFIQQMEQILSETKTVQEAVVCIQNEIEDSVVTVENYVESAKGYSDLSNTYAMQSKQYAEEAAQQAESAEEFADRAYDEAERAKMYAENASSVTDVQIATKDRAGLIKGGENYIAEDGTLTLTKRIISATLHDSYEGGILVHEIGGKSEQDGIPAPDEPVEIKSVVLSEIKASGKNRLHNMRTAATLNGITFTVNEDKSVTANGTATSDATFAIDATFNKPGQYIMTGCPEGGSATTYYMVAGGAGYDYGNGLNVNVENVARFIAITIMAGYTANNLTFYPMIREANIADATYEPYKEITTTLSEPITLNGNGDVKDRIVRKDGVWSVERVIHNYTPGGVSKLAEEGTFGVLVMPGSVKPRLSTHNILCNVCEATTTLEIGKTLDYAICCYGNFLYLRNADIENTAAAYNAWLKNNTVTVFYERAESVFEPLPDVDQIALNSLQSFDTVTYLSCDSEVQSVIDVEYGTSKIGAYTLEAWNKAENSRIKTEKLITALLMMNQG